MISNGVGQPRCMDRKDSGWMLGLFYSTLRLRLGVFDVDVVVAV